MQVVPLVVPTLGTAMDEQNQARLQELENRVEKAEKKILALQYLANETTRELAENTRRDEMARKLSDDHETLRKDSKKGQFRVVGIIAIVVFFYVNDQLQANDALEALMIIGSSAGWWTFSNFRSENK